MSELDLFIGPPSDRDHDDSAVAAFLSESGRKFIIGGTTVSIFERLTGYKSVVDLSTSSDGVPPYGDLNGMTACEGTVTLIKLNKIFFSEYVCENAAALLKENIRSAGKIRIFIGTGTNRVNGIDKEPVVTRLIKNIGKSGIVPDIVRY